MGPKKIRQVGWLRVLEMLVRSEFEVEGEHDVKRLDHVVVDWNVQQRAQQPDILLDVEVYLGWRELDVRGNDVLELRGPCLEKDVDFGHGAAVVDGRKWLLAVKAFDLGDPIVDRVGVLVCIFEGVHERRLGSDFGDVTQADHHDRGVGLFRGGLVHHDGTKIVWDAVWAGNFTEGIHLANTGNEVGDEGSELGG